MRDPAPRDPLAPRPVEPRNHGEIAAPGVGVTEGGEGALEIGASLGGVGLPAFGHEKYLEWDRAGVPPARGALGGDLELAPAGHGRVDGIDPGRGAVVNSGHAHAERLRVMKLRVPPAGNVVDGASPAAHVVVAQVLQTPPQPRE